MRKGERMSDLRALEAKINYTFRERSLLMKALTHSSYAHENKAGEDNERLEFLGDAILSGAIGNLLYLRYPDANEGVLSAYKRYLVRETTLYGIACRLSLGEYLLLGKGELQQGGKEKKSILADAMEALVAAIFLDGKEELFSVIETLFSPELVACERMGDGDCKSRLQQLVEQDGQEKLVYKLSATRGPVHNPIFEVEACLNSNVIGRGSGRTKQEAEQQAACEALALFGMQKN